MSCSLQNSRVDTHATTIYPWLCCWSAKHELSSHTTCRLSQNDPVSMSDEPAGLLILINFHQAQGQLRIFYYIACISGFPVGFFFANWRSRMGQGMWSPTYTHLRRMSSLTQFNLSWSVSCSSTAPHHIYCRIILYVILYIQIVHSLQVNWRAFYRVAAYLWCISFNRLEIVYFIL